MTKTEQNRVLAWRLKVLREASAAPRNVAQACQLVYQAAGPFTSLPRRTDRRVRLRAKALRGALSRLIPSGESRRSDLRE
jgi:hypothetical protein